MRETWRWFGPDDAISLNEIRQTGAVGIVAALYRVPPGDLWPEAEIKACHDEIKAAGLTWDVVESLPVSEAILTGAPEAEAHIANWITSMQRLAAEGIHVICYNLMPVVDWTRTDLAFARPTGAVALGFDLTDFAAFDIHVLGRDEARGAYPDAIVAAAEARLPDLDTETLTKTILVGLPGAVKRWDVASFKEQLKAYDGIDKAQLRANVKRFLDAVVPEAEKLGMRMCAHPDDPPWPLFGLPRILSTEADYQWLVDAVPSPANGITFCTGSLGARADNDLPGMMRRMGDKVHFLHLRNTSRSSADVPTSFFEDDHLEGDTDMVAVIQAIRAQEQRRAAEGRADTHIPMRPDHGHMLLDDHARRAAPGYPAIGRLRGLAELRGITRAVDTLA